MYTLYYLEGCPFCKKVSAFAEKNGIKFNLKDINETGNRDELIRMGGKSQVPFLTKEGTDIALYESDSIIALLKEEIIPS